MVTCTGHIGIHEGADGRTDVRTLYVRTDVDDVMAIKPNFLTSMGYHIFLTMVLRARAELRYNGAFLHPGTQVHKWVPANLMLKGNPAMDWHPIHRVVEILPVASFYINRR